MSHNTFGHLFRVTTWGESHGPALGCVVDGCPPGIALTEADVQVWLEKRRPGQGKFVTQRQEPDAVKILSGVFSDERHPEQVTTGTPISMLIENVDQRSRDYSEIATAFRPGHADYTYQAKYGVRDYRGGGRQSARETAARVAAGAVARLIVPGVTIRGAVVQIGPHAVAPDRIDFAEAANNQFWCPDPGMVGVWEEHLEAVRKAGSSTGAIVAVEATGVPAGWGAPIYGKLDADLAAAFMSINAAQHAAGAVRQEERPVGAHPHLVGVLLARERRGGEARADLHALGGVDRHQGAGQLGVELAVDGRAPAGGRAERLDRHDGAG